MVKLKKTALAAKGILKAFFFAKKKVSFLPTLTSFFVLNKASWALILKRKLFYYRIKEGSSLLFLPKESLTLKRKGKYPVKFLSLYRDYLLKGYFPFLFGYFFLDTSFWILLKETFFVLEQRLFPKKKMEVSQYPFFARKGKYPLKR